MNATVSRLKPASLPTLGDVSHFNFDNCPVRDLLSQIGGKWSTLLLQALSERPYRFGELRTGYLPAYADADFAGPAA
jgi:DNA-binding HxlR family transcriptional regulator